MEGDCFASCLATAKDAPRNDFSSAAAPVPARGTGWLRWLGGALALIAPAVVIFWLTAAWPDTPDGLFHLHRVRALADALRMGVFYPRWFPDFAFGYGYPVLNFYAPAFYYPPTVLHLAGLDLIVAVRVSLAAWYALSGLAAYALLRCWVRPLPAALGAVLYLAYPYRLYDLFVRGALPEFAAFLWLPLIAWATVPKIASPSAGASEVPGAWGVSIGAPWPLASVAAALGWAGLILTHNLTALMAALAGLAMAALWTAAVLLRGPRGDRRRALLAGPWALTWPLALGAGLSAVYALPALLEAPWVGLAAGADGRGYAAHFAGLAGLFDRSLIYRYPAASQLTVPAPGYAALLLILVALALLLPHSRGRRLGLGISAGMTLGALWLSTASSAFLWDALARVLGKLQFPWRWQTVAGLALACTLGWLLDIGGRWLASAGPLARPRLAWWAITCGLAGWLAFHGYAGLPSAPATFRPADLTTAQMWEFDARHGQLGATWTAEFLPRWVTEQRWAIGREPSGTAAAAQPARPAFRSVRVLAQSHLGERLRYTAAAPGQLIYHAFYYPAWRVEVDGRAAKTRAVGDLGLLAADLPAGEHEVTRRWGVTPAVWAGRGLSAIAWLTTLGLLILTRDRRRLLWIGLWLMAAAVAAVGASGWLAREQAAIPVDADYGIVRLEAAVAPPACAGETAPVTLHWLATASPEPLTAFVHVITPDGRVATGHDAPLAGVYTPSGRWHPGQLLPDRHEITLPAHLPAGVYQLKAGVYRPGAADAPLAPVGHGPHDPRVDIGFLEVRP